MAIDKPTDKDKRNRLSNDVLFDDLVKTAGVPIPKCPYLAAIFAMVPGAHPTIFAMMGKGTRAAIMRLAAECRRSWKRTVTKPVGTLVFQTCKRTD